MSVLLGKQRENSARERGRADEHERNLEPDGDGGHGLGALPDGGLGFGRGLGFAEPLGPEHLELPHAGLWHFVTPLGNRAWSNLEDRGQRCGGSGLLNGL